MKTLARLQAQGELTVDQIADCHLWYSEGEAARRAVFLARVNPDPTLIGAKNHR